MTREISFYLIFLSGTKKIQFAEIKTWAFFFLSSLWNNATAVIMKLDDHKATVWDLDNQIYAWRIGSHSQECKYCSHSITGVPFPGRGPTATARLIVSESQSMDFFLEKGNNKGRTKELER